MSRRRHAAGILILAMVIAVALAWWFGRPSGTATGSERQHLDATTALADTRDASPAPPVTARLLSDVEIIQPGTAFRLGVMLRARPGWHIVAPTVGEATSPTAVRFRLPNDFTAEPMMAPPPVEYRRPDTIVRRGYADDVLMFARVHASNLDPDRDWHFAADITWTACADECASGETMVDLWLPASISGTRLQNFRNIQLFDAWAPRMREP